MKKPVIFLILLAVAALGLFLMDYISSAKEGSYKGGGMVEEPKVVKDFKSFCDSMSDKPWNSEEYYKRKNTLKVYTDQQVVDAAQGYQLEEYMNYRYARSISNTFDAWKRGCDDRSLPALEKEARVVVRWKGCSSILQKTLNEMGLYHRMRSLKARYRNLLSGEYQEGVFNALQQEVSGMPGPFSCSVISAERSEMMSGLSDFKSFAIGFQNAWILYNYDASEYQNLEAMRGYCPENYNGIYRYPHYLGKIASLNLCNY